ncbi:D-glycero-alpha-D-manno-heptose-1,7-bisphosphate 7-phosphatase [Alkalicoccobacillus porphyridii]|uniref:D,D-heptose 1,7-bisphosphate phosphatase n=1 Tax=Alkalicoccobacillus porphyridii TaxID=2597270 RepID=A0A554A0V9_9BACI|nr:HAD family hydrolase [Alkalicoccobacillus porphyridii]TSB47332.1 HAD family hydrolase [Alkalicoccobacillus porphyridii]
MNQAVFLDRDGVINEVLSNRVRFVNRPSDLYLLTGVGESIRQFNEAGFTILVVTNQGGVGLGHMSEEQVETIHTSMKEKLSQDGAVIDDIMYCSHKPNSDCPCRKPKAYMLEKLAEKHQINLRESIMVGDREPDILAGQNAGCRTVLVHARTKQSFGADLVCKDLKAAVPWILKQKLK